MRVWALLAVVFGLGACSPALSTPPRVDCRASCSIKHVVRVDPAFSKEEVPVVWKGLTAWTESTFGAVCFVPEGDAGRRGFSLVVVRGENQTWLRPYIDEWASRGAIYHDGSIVIAMDVSRSALDAIVAHEAGHALGLDHVWTENSVMYYRTTGLLVEGHLNPTDRALFWRERCR